MEYYSYFYYILQLILAIFLGGVIGWQREHIGKPAGPRTYALVCVGAALFTLMSIEGFGQDMARVAAQILTGIGFLGAGIIMHKEGGVVTGLTTAAGLWVVSAVGMAIGLGWFWQAIVATVMIFTVMSINDNEMSRPRKKRKK